MTRRVFIKCLNAEPKIFNCNLGSLIGAVVLLTLFGLSKGLMWGLGGSAIGLTIGGHVSRQWFLGDFQKKLYWHVPYQKLWIDKNVPESHNRNLV